MTRAGIILAIIGVVGFVLNFTQVYPMRGFLGDVRVWGGVAIAGALLAIVTRRPMD